MSKQASKVACPNCGTSVLWSQEFPYRPFCSERCKMVDLGAWFTEERSIPVDDPGNFSTSSEDS